MKLYYLPGACSLADHIVLEWIGQPYEAHRVARDELASSYLSINPAGVVPALQEDDGWVLTENAAILNYLADKYPQAGVGGDGSARSRAEVNRWLAYINSDLHPAFRPVFRPERFIDGEAAQETLRATAIVKLRRYYERLDAQLADREWLTGARSFADPYLFVVLNWAKGKGVDLSGLDNLARFHQRMLQDTGVKAAMQQEGL
jgi:glutathione S-transferase